MSFGAPLWLLAVPGVAALLLLDFALRLRRRRKLERMFPSGLRADMCRNAAPRLDAWRAFLFRTGLLLAAFALARPQWGYTWRDARREGLEMVVAIDTSNSMRADDFEPTRLRRAQWGVEELVRALKGDQLALVAFAGEGVLQAPMTLDYGAFLMSLQDLFPGIVPTGGTNLEAALSTAMDGFENQAEADRVILLITDGEQHQGNLDEVTADLSARDIRVFTVGVGTPEGALIPLDETAGEFLKNRNREVVKSSLNEAPLRRLAEQTGGLYVRATPRDFGVGRIVDEGLKPLKRAQLESARVQEMEERYQIFLGAGLLCLLLEGLARIPGAWSRRRRI